MSGVIVWKSDEDDENSVDDLHAHGADVHLERMDSGFYWLGITVDGVTHHFDLHSKRKIRAFARQPSPPDWRKRRTGAQIVALAEQHNVVAADELPGMIESIERHRGKP